MGGFPVVISTNGRGTPVTESPNGAAYEIADNGRGTPVIFVDSGGVPVTRVIPTWAIGLDWWRDFTTEQGNMPYPTDVHAQTINALDAAADYEVFGVDALTRTDLGLQTVPTSTNILNRSVFTGTPGPNTRPTGWTNAGSSPTVCTLLAAETVAGLSTQPVRLRRIAATGLEGISQTTPQTEADYTISALVRRPAGVVAAPLVMYNTVQQVIIASAATVNAQPDDVWVRYAATATILPASVNSGFVLGDGAAGTGVDIAFPQIQIGTFATPPILTEATALTVTGNVQTIMNPPFNNGVCGFIKVDIRQPAGAVEYRLFEMDDGTSNNRIFLFNNAANNRLKFLASVNGATTNSQEVGDWYEGVQTIAFAVAQGFFAQRRVGEANPGKFSASWPAIDRIILGGAGYTTTLNNYQSIIEMGLNFGPQNAASFDAMFARAVLADAG